MRSLDALLDAAAPGRAPARPAARRALPARCTRARRRTRSSITRCAMRGALGQPRRARLVNAVLRNFLRKRDAAARRAARTETARYSHPQWWIDKLRAQYPRRYASMLEAGNLHPPLTLRVNRRRDHARRLSGDCSTARDACGDVRSAAVARSRSTAPCPVERIPGFAEGLVSVQDAAAQLAAPSPRAAQPGSACSTRARRPGGKTAHMLELRRRRSDCARRTTRAARARARESRAAGSCCALVCGDAARAGGLVGWPARSTASSPTCRAPLRASCAAIPTSSGCGARRTSQRSRATAARMLDALWRLLASDGKLLYATCSVFHEENHEQVERFLERHRDARRLKLPGPHTDPRRARGPDSSGRRA